MTATATRRRASRALALRAERLAARVQSITDEQDIKRIAPAYTRICKPRRRGTPRAALMAARADHGQHELIAPATVLRDVQDRCRGRRPRASGREHVEEDARGRSPQVLHQQDHAPVTKMFASGRAEGIAFQQRSMTWSVAHPRSVQRISIWSPDEDHDLQQERDDVESRHRPVA